MPVEIRVQFTRGEPNSTDGFHHVEKALQDVRQSVASRINFHLNDGVQVTVSLPKKFTSKGWKFPDIAAAIADVLEQVDHRIKNRVDY